MPARVQRLDVELTRRGLARSREQAAALIAAGRVEVRGVIARKPATGVAADTPVRVLADDDGTPDYASRGGVKLAGALADFGALDIAGKRCLDAGASTGGFTDVLLRAGARRGGRGRRRLRAAGLAVAVRRPRRRPRPHERACAAARGHRRSGRGHGRRPVVHLAAAGAAGSGRLHRRRRRPAADGQAAVRGRPRAAGQRRRGARPGAARRRGARRWPTRHANWAGARPGCAPAACPARRGTWNSSSGCGANRVSSARTTRSGRSWSRPRR